MKKIWEVIESTQSLRKDESRNMLEQESQIQETKPLDEGKSIVERMCSWANHFVDVINLFEVLND